MRGLIAVLVVTVLGAPGAERADAHPWTPSTTVCVCDVIRVPGGWCAVCPAGYVAGVRTTSAPLMDVIDPGGHDVDPSAMRCRPCRAALAADGYCEGHGIGFRAGRAYVSRLAYLLSASEPGLCPERCPDCRRETPRWCDACGHGVLGAAIFTDRAGFQAALPEWETLRRAAAHTCPWCAAAEFTGGRCPECRIDYGDRAARCNGSDDRIRPDDPDAADDRGGAAHEHEAVSRTETRSDRP